MSTAGNWGRNAGLNSLISLAGAVLVWRMLALTPPGINAALERTEVQILFDELVQAGFIQTTTDASITIPPSDWALAAAWRGDSMEMWMASPRPTPLDSHKPQVLGTQTNNLLQDLYGSAAGVALQGQIALWNGSRRITAIRDNGVSQGVTHVGWHAYDCHSGKLLESRALVAEQFGYVHQGLLRQGFSAWTAVAATGSCVEWRGEFRANKALPVEVWYIGQPIMGSEQRIGFMTTFMPPRSQKLPSCINIDIPQQQAGSWLLPKGAWQAETGRTLSLSVRLRITPAHNPSLDPQGLQVGVDVNCQPKWQAVANSRPQTTSTWALSAHEANSWQLYTADGVPLLTSAATPTPQAQALGLLPLIGYGSDDSHGLAGKLRLAGTSGQLTLTIDSKMQQKAHAILTNRLKKLPQPDWATERRAALVLVNTSGAILAAVGFPDIPDLHAITPWDLAAFAKVYPLNNPLLVRAWEEVDRHQAAGSTFKPVTALAGLTKALESPKIAAMMNGMSPKAFQALTGLSLQDFKIDPYRIGSQSSAGLGHPTIQNFRFEPLSRLLRKEGRAGNCPDQAPNKYDLSLASAVRDSLNIWFVALVMQMDGAAADRYQQDNPPTLLFAETMRDLGFGTAQPLFAVHPAGLTPNLLQTTPEQIDLLGPAPTPLRWVLAQNSIGQGALVTPLRMATLAATIASDSYVRPHLDAAWNGEVVVLRPFAPLHVDTTLLKRGMQAVVQTGTTHSAFLKTPPSIRCHTYAKTGTAQVAKRNDTHSRESYGTAWTIGWHEPQEAEPVAFACMVTHTQNTGGEMCGPIIAELLQAIAK